MLQPTVYSICNCGSWVQSHWHFCSVTRLTRSFFGKQKNVGYMKKRLDENRYYTGMWRGVGVVEVIQNRVQCQDLVLEVLNPQILLSWVLFLVGKLAQNIVSGFLNLSHKSLLYLYVINSLHNSVLRGTRLGIMYDRFRWEIYSQLTTKDNRKYPLVCMNTHTHMRFTLRIM